MSEEKVTLKENVNVKYVKAGDLTPEMKSKLENVTCLIKTSINKKRRSVNYTLTMKIHDEFQITKFLTKTQYFLICRKFKIDKFIPSHLINAKIRFIKSNSNVENKWFRYELYVCAGVEFKEFINNESDLYMLGDLLKNKEFNYNVFESPEEFTVDEILKIDDPFSYDEF